MNFEFVYKHFPRVIFIIASIGIVAAFLEWIGDFVGFSVTGDMYSAGRLLELSAALLVFVVAVLLRQIRDELRAGQTS